MNTITLDKLATANPNVTFIHSWPGLVPTGNAKRTVDPNSLLGWFVWLVLDPLVRLLGMSEDESGQRNLFQCTSAAFGGRGTAWQGQAGINAQGKSEDGLFLVSYKCDSTPNSKVMPVLREKAQERVWDHTQKVLEPYL
jgi:hypothetical protein